jgi:hypothetical protein
METDIEDQPQDYADIWNAWWTDEVDQDGDGYVRSARLNWDPDVADCSGSLTVFERIYWRRPCGGGSWNFFTETAPHAITDCYTSDQQYVDIIGGSHNTYDWRIRIYRVGESSPDDTYDDSDDPDLSCYEMEIFIEDELPRTIEFAGYQWNVKSGISGPGPNYWSSSTQNVWVDGDGKLHLKIREQSGIWLCSEVYTEHFTSYGLHRFYIEGRMDLYDRNVVAGLFLYKDSSNEIDIEFSKWGSSNPGFNSQYVVQPWDHQGNLERFLMNLNGTHSTHYINWQPYSIRFKSIHGHYDEPPNDDYLIHEWLYTGNDIPSEEEQLRVHLNLWLYQGIPPSDGEEVEIIFTEYMTGIEDTNNRSIPYYFSVFGNYPNPFNTQTTIRYALPEASNVTIEIYDLLGRQVETLVNSEQRAGYHSVSWNANRQPSGMYFYKLQAGEFIETKKMLLLK